MYRKLFFVLFLCLFLVKATFSYDYSTLTHSFAAGQLISWAKIMQNYNDVLNGITTGTYKANFAEIYMVDSLAIDDDKDLTVKDVNATGSVTGNVVTDGTASLTGGVWTGITTATVTTLNVTDIALTNNIIVSNNAVIGFSESLARIEFDDQTTDEINILGAKVGIGTQVPSQRLDVYLDADSLSAGAFRNVNGGSSAHAAISISSGANADPYVQWSLNSGQIWYGLIDNSDSDSFKLDTSQTSPNDFFVIETGGQVGIGVGDPDATLEIFDTTTQLKLSYDGTNFTSIFSDSAGMLNITPAGGTTAFKPAATKQVISAGNQASFLDSDAMSILGVNISRYQFTNDVDQVAGAPTIELGGNLSDGTTLGAISFFDSGNDDTYKNRVLITGSNSGTGSANKQGGIFSIYTAADDATDPTIRVTLDETGNFGIGASSPSSILEIETSSGDQTLTLDNNANSGDITLQFDALDTGSAAEQALIDFDPDGILSASASLGYYADVHTFVDDTDGETPALTTYKNDATNDANISEFNFWAEDSVSNTHQYSQIIGKIRSNSNPNEDGSLILNVSQSGSSTTYLELHGGEEELNVAVPLDYDGDPGGSGGTAVEITAAGGIIYGVTSSKRFKSNITDTKIDTDQIYNLVVKDYFHKQSGHNDFGLIAEEVIEHIPELVVLDEKGIPYSVNYSKVSLILLEELKKMRLVNNDLIKRVEQLEK